MYLVGPLGSGRCWGIASCSTAAYAEQVRTLAEDGCYSQAALAQACVACEFLISINGTNDPPFVESI